MSYIRSTGNPEAMYIWGDADCTVTVMKGPDVIGTLPTDVMDGLINKYINGNCPDDCDYKGAKVEEVWIPVPTERITEEMKIMSLVSTPMVRLSYGDWKVDMWDVTWYYIARSNVK
jgi:hypothetical protein